MVVYIGLTGCAICTQLVIRTTEDEEIYNFSYAPAGIRLSIRPGNLGGGPLTLDGGLGLEARLVWRSSHNLPNTSRKNGGRAKFANELVFEVPEGITMPQARKTGERVVDGKKIITYVQKERCAYNAQGWIKSFLRTTLPPGAAGVIRDQLRWENGVQPFQELPFKVIEVKPAPRPKKFIAGFYHGWISSMDAARSLGRVGDS